MKLIRNCSGATAAEYALIIAVVGGAISVAALGLGSAVTGSMNTSSGHVANCAGEC